MTILNDFFSKTYEKYINKQMLYKKYIFQFKDVNNYIDSINSIKIDDFINEVYIRNNVSHLNSRDIFQFSSFNDATIKLSKKISMINNPGLKVIDIGKLLLDDNMIRKNGAYTKYGENHAKTAESIGLMFELSNTYFLSCIGFIYHSLNKMSQDKLICRLLLRNIFVTYILNRAKLNIVDMRNELKMLSDSTYIRRKSNIKTILNKLITSTEYDFSFLNQKIKY